MDKDKIHQRIVRGFIQVKCLRYAITILTLMAFTKAGMAMPMKPEFSNTSGEVSKSGYFKLSWRWAQQADTDYFFELQQADNDHFENPDLIYRGPDLATFISGLKNGSYYYRIRVVLEKKQEQSEWSDVLLIRVRHHNLTLAISLFGIGALVFFFTVGIVIKGDRSSVQNNQGK